MTSKTNTVSIPKMTRQEATQKARDLLHSENVSHENERSFQMALSLVLRAWREFDLITD